MASFFLHRLKRREFEDLSYRHRFMAGVIAALIIMLLIVRFWPASEFDGEEESEQLVFRDNVLFDHVEITRQESAPPPPPVRRLPVPVPDDVIIEDTVDLDFEMDFNELADLPESVGVGLEGDNPVIMGSPQLPPTVVKIVEPHVPNLPGDMKGRVELLVNFLVNSSGGVEEASIAQIRLYNNDFSEYEVLDTIGHDVMSTTLEAAYRWEFREARHGGEGVWAYTTHRFNY